MSAKIGQHVDFVPPIMRITCFRGWAKNRNITDFTTNHHLRLGLLLLSLHLLSFPRLGICLGLFLLLLYLVPVLRFRNCSGLCSRLGLPLSLLRLLPLSGLRICHGLRLRLGLGLLPGLRVCLGLGLRLGLLLLYLPFFPRLGICFPLPISSRFCLPS